MNPSERQGRDALDVFESGQNISQHVAGAVFDSIHRKHFNSSTLGFSKCTKNVLQFKFLQSKNVIIIISYIIIKVPILKRCWVANSHYFGHIGEWNRGCYMSVLCPTFCNATIINFVFLTSKNFHVHRLRHVLIPGLSCGFLHFGFLLDIHHSFIIPSTVLGVSYSGIV